ncbi:MAG: polyprenyl synthetase family protein [Pyrinomonadaceae bacterium]|nr:polyprenyl synthetase family protein [Phycisphaerales bacterium]
MPSLLDLPADLAPLQSLLERSLVRVERRFDEQLVCDLPPVNRLCEHVEQYRGKMLRPMLVVLCGLACRAADPASATDESNDSGVTDDHIAVAAVCEMIHMATLVHDDVLDEADTRRKGGTINRLHGNEAAVILGDYLFSAAYQLCSGIPGQVGRDASLLIGQTGMTLCAGELLQLEHRGDYSIDEPVYFEIVKRKTASLIAAACRLGATLSEGPGGPQAPRLDQVGLKLGVAFQIQDDLLDLTGNQEIVGKSLGKDVALGKLTLPIIHHLATAPAIKRGQTLSILRQYGEFAQAPSELLRVALDSTESIGYARGTAQNLVAESKVLLDELPDSAAKVYLHAMADAVINRAS